MLHSFDTWKQMLETKYQHVLLHPSPQNQIYPAQCMECIAKARIIKGVYQLLNSLVGNLLSRFSLQVTWDMLDYCPWWMRLSAHHARQLLVYSIYRLQSRRYEKWPFDDIIAIEIIFHRKWVTSEFRQSLLSRQHEWVVFSIYFFSISGLLISKFLLWSLTWKCFKF